MVALGVVASEVVVTVVVTGSGVAVVSKGKGRVVSWTKVASGVINGRVPLLQ
jgi:hypothetical protein